MLLRRTKYGLPRVGMRMKEKRAQEIREKLAVFGQGKLQDLITLYDFLEESDISLEDVRAYLEYNKEVFRQLGLRQAEIFKKRKEVWNKNTRKCPTCKRPLLIGNIRTPKGRGNVKGYTCHWFCQEEDCLFEEYTYENFQEVYKKIMGGR